MAKRMLLVASERDFAEPVRAAAARADLGCELAVGEMDAIVGSRAVDPDIIVVCDHPMRRAMSTRNAIRSVAELASMPMLVLTSDDGSRLSPSDRRPEHIERYLPVATSAEELVRAALAMIPERPAARRADVPSSVARPPPVPSAAVRAVGNRPSIAAPRGAATAVAVATQMEPQTRVGVQERKESGVQPAVEATRASVAAPVRPSALEMEALRREQAEARRVREALERRLAESEERSREVGAALVVARREREESDASWTAWVTSAEQCADKLWQERDAIARALTEAQRGLEASRVDATQTHAALDEANAAVLRCARERDDARGELDGARGEISVVEGRLAALGEEAQRGREAILQLEAAQERIATLHAEVDRTAAASVEQIALSEAHVHDERAAREEAEANAADARIEARHAEAACTAAGERARELERQLDERGQQLTARDGELLAARADLTRVHKEIDTLRDAQGKVTDTAEELVRAQRVIRHLLRAQQRARAKHGGADESTLATLRLCNRIIETQDQRIRTLDQILTAPRPIDPKLLAESKRLTLELQVLLAQLQRTPTSRH